MKSYRTNGKIDKISVVIPLYNEEESITLLLGELRPVLDKIGIEYEVVLVNDGSTDNTLRVLKSLQGVTIIDLNRNYGQAVALDAGFKEASGDVVVSLDGDGQNDPRDIPLLLKKLQEEDLDVVAGWRRKRKDSRSICFITHVARFLRRAMISDVVKDSGCTLRVYRREAVKSLDIGGEMHRYIMALLRWKGFTIGEMEVNHRERKNGVSKYNSSKAFRGFVDLIYIWFIYKYSQRPVHFFGAISFLSTAFGSIALFWAVYSRIVYQLSLNRNGWFFIGFFCVLIGVVFFTFGIIIDLLIKIQLTTSPYERRYYIRRLIKK